MPAATAASSGRSIIGSLTRTSTRLGEAPRARTAALRRRSALPGPGLQGPARHATSALASPRPALTGTNGIPRLRRRTAAADGPQDAVAPPAPAYRATNMLAHALQHALAAGQDNPTRLFRQRAVRHRIGQVQTGRGWGQVGHHQRRVALGVPEPRWSTRRGRRGHGRRDGNGPRSSACGPGNRPSTSLSGSPPCKLHTGATL